MYKNGRHELLNKVEELREWFTRTFLTGFSKSYLELFSGHVHTNPDSNRTGTSVDDDARKSNNWLDQSQSSKLSTGSRVQSFPCAFSSSTDVPVLLLNQPNVSVTGFTGFARGRSSRGKADSWEKYI